MIAAMELWLATCHDIKTTFNATNKIQNKIIIRLIRTHYQCKFLKISVKTHNSIQLKINNFLTSNGSTSFLPYSYRLRCSDLNTILEIKVPASILA